MALKEAKPGTSPARQQAIEELRRVVLAAIEGHDAAVWLFGSCARGEARKDSDIDIGILPRDDVSPAWFASLAAEIEEGDIPYDVDLFDLRCVDPAVMEAVRREGIRWRK